MLKIKKNISNLSKIKIKRIMKILTIHVIKNIFNALELQSFFKEIYTIGTISQDKIQNQKN